MQQQNIFSSANTNDKRQDFQLDYEHPGVLHGHHQDHPAASLVDMHSTNQQLTS